MLNYQSRGFTVGLSEEEKKELGSFFLNELEKEHTKREDRALRKREKQHDNQILKESKRNSEVTQLRSEIQKKFYEDRGYRLEKDQTGRDMWLSPSEQENKKKKRARRKSNRSSKNKLLKTKPIALYFFIILFAFLLGLIITK